MSSNVRKIVVGSIAISFIMLAISSFLFYRARAAAVEDGVSRIKRGQFLAIPFDGNFGCEARLEGIEISADSWIVVRFKVHMVSTGKIPKKSSPNIQQHSNWGLREWKIVNGGFDFSQ